MDKEAPRAMRRGSVPHGHSAIDLLESLHAGSAGLGNYEARILRGIDLQVHLRNLEVGM